MNIPMDDRHAWSLERLEEYVAGGLSHDERTALEAHAAQCAACGHALHDLTEMDQNMQSLFSIARPAPDFENRIIARLWRATWRARLSTPTMKRVRFAIAASLLLGCSGLFATYAVQNNVLSNPLSGALSDSGHVLMPNWMHGRSRELANRSAFGANVTGVDKAISIDAHDYIEQRDGKGDSMENLWKLALKGNVGPKQFMQKSDPASPASGEGNQQRGWQTEDGPAGPAPVVTFYNGQSAHRFPADDHSGKATAVVTSSNGDTGIISGRGSLTKTGTGQLTLGNVATSGTIALNFNGGTVHAAGGTSLHESSTPFYITKVPVRQDLALGDIHVDFAKNPYVAQGGDSIWSKGGRPGTVNQVDLPALEHSGKDTTVENLTVTGSLDDSASKTGKPNEEKTDGDRSNAANPGSNVAKPEPTATSEIDGPKGGFLVGTAISSSLGLIGQVTLETTTPPPAIQPSPAAQATAANQKVIRSGTMEFEVRNFDDAVDTISTVIKEEGGFVSGTNSEKLANGKVKGTIVVRVDPARLDRVVLKLRGLGELKTQQISAQDITKEYTDLESELRANRAMEERMLDIIKTGKGSVKELVEAEKQLGVYREKIEKIEGEKRYYDNLVGLSTLSITLFEKDIQTAATAAELESVTMSVETEDVETKFADAKAFIEKDAGGRVIKAELKKYEADQLAGMIMCEVPAEKADFLVAQLKQLGKVARLDRERSQSTQGGNGTPTANIKVEQKATQITLSLYNLANIAPRQTAVLTVAVPNVEEAYNKVLARVRQQMGADKADATARPAAGIVVTSNIAGQNADQMTADVRADVRVAEAAAVLADVRQLGEVMNSTITENPDTANVTTSKEGIALRLVAIAAVPSREAQTLQLAAADVPAAYQKLVDAMQVLEGQKGGRILQSQLNQQDPRTITGALEVDLRRADQGTFETALTASGAGIVARNVTRSTDTANTLDTKVHYAIALTGAETLPARQSTIAGIEVEDVERATADLHAAIVAGHGKELDAGISKDAGGHMVSRIIAEVPLAEASALQSKLQILGKERTNEVSQNPQATDGPLARAHFEITLSNAEMLMPQDKSIGSTLRAAVAASLGTLLWSLYLIVNGLLVIGPFAVVAWVAWKALKRKKATT